MGALAKELVALCFAVWAGMHPSLPLRTDAPAIAEGCTRAVLAESARAPALSSHADDAATCAYYAAKESANTLSAEGDGGKSHGAWQVQSIAPGLSADAQARAWLYLLHESVRTCPAHPTAGLHGSCLLSARPADRRLRKARELLSQSLPALALEGGAP